MQLDPVASYDRKSFGKLSRQGHVALHRFGPAELDHLADCRTHLNAVVARGPLLDQIANAVDHGARTPSLTMLPSARFASSRSGAGRSSHRSAALALVTVAAIGWFTSWAIDAVSCPVVSRRLARKLRLDCRKLRLGEDTIGAVV